MGRKSVAIESSDLKIEEIERCKERCKKLADGLSRAAGRISLLAVIPKAGPAAWVALGLEGLAVLTEIFGNKIYPYICEKGVADEPTARFIISAVDGYYIALEMGILSGPPNFTVFMDNEVNLFDGSRWKALPFEKQFTEHVKGLAEKNEWSYQVENKFSILFSHQIAKYVTADSAGFNIKPPEFKLHQFDSVTIERNINDSFDCAMHDLEPQFSKLMAAHFTSPLISNYFQSGIHFTEEQLAQLTETATAKISETLASTRPSVNALQSTAAKSASINLGALQTGMREASGMMQDVAMIAIFCKKPEFANSLSTVRTSMEHTVGALIKIENSPLGSFSKLSGVLSLATGMFGIISGFASFFDDRPDPMEHMEHISKQIEGLGKQVEHLGEQLDCVLKNQMKAAEILFLNSQRLEEIQVQLTRFAETTKQQLNFIATQDLIQANHNINLYLTDSSAVVLNQTDLHRCLVTLQTWITDSQHLSSTQMNGALLNRSQPIPPKEAIEILSTLTDWSSSMNMVGLVLRQLQHRGCSIPDKYLNLPPLELYTKTLITYYFGLSKLKKNSSHGCHVISEKIKETYDLFTELLEFLTGDEQIWKNLKRLYVDYYCKVENLIIKEMAIFQTPYQGHIADHLNKISNTDLNKLQLQDALHYLEEIRLLLVALSQWTGKFKTAIARLPSIKDILNLPVNPLHDFKYPLWRSFYAMTQDTQVAKTPFDKKESFVTFGHEFSKPSLRLMEYWFENKLYEPLILHIASGDGDAYHCPHGASNIYTLFPKSCNDYMMKGAIGNFRSSDFMVIISLFVGRKLVALRTAYQYYAASFNNDQQSANRLRPSVDRQILLWLVAILGRYDIFQTLTPHHTFNYAAHIGMESIGRHGYGIPTIHDDCYTDTLYRRGGCMIFQLAFTATVTPLWIAAKWNRIDVLNGLLNACRQEKKDVVGLLMKNTEGKCAAQIAFDQGHYAAAKLLDDCSYELFNEHLLSTSDHMKAMPDSTLSVIEGNHSNTMHEAILEVIAAGKQFAESIETLGQSVMRKKAIAWGDSERQSPIHYGTSAAMTSAAAQKEGDQTDSEDLDLLYHETDTFAASTSATACASSRSLWKKPDNAKQGVRELRRETLSGNTASLFYKLRATRGEKVAISSNAITVQLLTTE